MHRPAGQPRQADIARDQDCLGRCRDARQAQTRGKFTFGGAATAGQRRILGMLHNAGAEAAGIGQHQPHQAGGRDGPGPVGERDRAGLAQQAKFGERFAAAAARGCAIRQDRDGSGFPAARDQHMHQSRIVDRRLAVRQRGQQL